MKPSDRTRLEIRITEALDGALSPDELYRLESELQDFPDLEKQYQQLKGLPDTSLALGHIEPPAFALGRLQSRLETEEEPFAFATLLGTYFRRYILTGATVLMIGVLSARYYISTNTATSQQASELLSSDVGEQLADIPEYQFLMDLGTTSTADHPEQN